MRNVPWLLAASFVGFFPAAYAQEAVGERPAGRAGGIQSRLSAPIDFWGKGLSAEKPKVETLVSEVGPAKIQIRESVWAQPVQTPDGSWMLYVPPKPVLDFLENPTEGTAKAYLAWKGEQAEKLARAMALLGQVKAANTNPAKVEVVPAEAGPEGDQAARSVTLVYFKKPSCPHCISQDQVLTQWLPRHPEIRTEPVLPGERPELWKAYGVRGTPTLVLRSEAGKEEVLVGMTPQPQLEAAIRRVVQPNPPAGK
jgi:hypothetical protein